jgi:phospholipase/lecithinase/hemolysin
MKKILTAILCSFLFYSVLSSAQANQPYNTIVFFGDSLTDNGNLYRSTLGIIPKSPPYFQGRFSNGSTWAEKITEFYTKRDHITTANYGVGGETTVFHNPADGYLPYTLGESVDDYLFRNAFNDKSHSLFIMWIGANDYLPQKQYDEPLVTTVVNTIKQNLEKLIANNATNILIVNLPDISKTPRGKESGPIQAILNHYMVAHNAKIAEASNQLKQHYPKVTIHFFDSNALFQNMIDNPDSFNQKYHTHVTDTAHACWGGGYTLRGDALTQSIQKALSTEMSANINTKTMDAAALARYITASPSLAETFAVSSQYANGVAACANPDDYLFWDHVHPSNVAHYMLSQAFIEFIDSHFKV